MASSSSALRREEEEDEVAKRSRYFVDLVAAHPLDLLALGRNMEDLASKGYRLHSVARHQDERRGACLLLFWERAVSVSARSAHDDD